MRSPAAATSLGPPMRGFLRTDAFMPHQGWACSSCGAALTPGDHDGTPEMLLCPWCLSPTPRP